MEHPLVVHCEHDRYDIYIGRGSKWGNPFVIGIDGTRDEVCDLYEQWLPEQPELMAALGELTDKTLGCFCDPDRCHGEFLAHLAARVPAPSPWATTPPTVGRLTAAMAPF